MKDEVQFDLIGFLRNIHKNKIRCLLIGRWAVAQHGAPVVTADYDFWVDPKDRTKLIRLLDEEYQAELPAETDWNKPLLSAYIGPDKIDCFSSKNIINEEGQNLKFNEVYRRAVEKRDLENDLIFKVPSIEDMIALKKFSHSDPTKHARNLEDIRYLQALKKK
ncbi:MAG: hypothetical protein JRJ87_19645 [Deltaproteobacteria bacterium]|nr:hypothetical protein [Deltaproteobacteria bacterium]